MKRPIQYKKALSILLFLAVISTQVILPSRASAVTVAGKTLNWNNPNQGGDPAYRLSVGNIINSDMLTSLVGCTGIVNKVAKVSTQFTSDLLKTKAERVALKAKRAEAKAAKKIVEAATKAVMAPTVAGPGVPAADVGVRVENIQKNIADAARADEAVKTQNISTDALNTALENNKQKMLEANFREECIDAIAVRLARNQLTAMTRNTMNWINSGFNGDPVFVRNINSYMDGLTQKILEEEEDYLKDPERTVEYPWGRDFAEDQVNDYKASQNSYDGLRQDLTTYLDIGATPDSFASNFSQGGWNGWLALTQHPQNNPLGFTLKAKEDLSRKQDLATATAQAELTRNGGIFDQKKCVLWKELDDPGTPVGIDESESSIKTSTRGTNQDGKIHPGDKNQTDVCIKFETVTPGSVIKSKIDKAINSPETQLELVKTLNDALNSLFASLLGTFENQGLSSLSAHSFTSVSSPFSSNNFVDGNGNVISSPSSSAGIGSGPNGAFDITRDLGNTYIQAVDDGKWNAKTNTPEILIGSGIVGHFYTVSIAGDTKISSDVDHWFTGEKVFFDGTNWKKGVPKYIIDKKGALQIEQNYLDKMREAEDTLGTVLSNVGELDYCIPGPNPNWKNTVLDTADEIIASESQIARPHQTAEEVDQYWSEAAQKLSAEYSKLVEPLYGETSPMQTEFLPGGGDNPSYLPMARVGLSITKNMSAYEDDIAQSKEDFKTSGAEAQNNMYRLIKIKNKLNIIIAAAQKRRDIKRVQAGLPKVSALCIDTERVTYISNGVLK